MEKETKQKLFTSESVTEGHPDKIADAISDAIVDDLLSDDPNSRVAVETLITTGQVHIAGEVTTNKHFNIPELVRKVIKIIGYDSSDKGFDSETCGINVSIGKQASEIAASVDSAIEIREGLKSDKFDVQGAGDQGLMFGYACDDTPDLMPMPITLAHLLAKKLAEVRHTGELTYLCPDGKTQVTIGYKNNIANSLDTIVISTQHFANINQNIIKKDLISLVINPIIKSDLTHSLDKSKLRILINPSGAFVQGGPCADTGLTGRKIIVDTYGGMARHGGGAFSGKDPSKVDRSGAYAMRWVAKNIVAAGFAKRCEVQVAYAIGVANPVGVFVETFGTGIIPDEQIQDAILQVFDLRPGAIIENLGLKSAIYSPTSAYGHFGKKSYEGIDKMGNKITFFSWENTNYVDLLQSAIRG